METASFSIRSSHSSSELIFSAPTREGFNVSYRDSDIQATRDVYEFRDPDGVAHFLHELAAFERPWIASKEWDSIEGDFSLAATCSSFGIVTFMVTLAARAGAPEQWRLVGSLATELGQLQGLANSASQFFRRSA